MTKPATGTDQPWGEFTDRLEHVLAAERPYLDERRRKNGLPDTGQDPDLWGVALSGGGIRSATFGLGVLQTLIGGGLLRRFDYLSTVSGGGYIGSCLSSLLSDRPELGVDAANSPFVGLRQDEDYTTPGKTRLGVRHQIHHLRTHGEYLIPRSHLLSRDVQRALGTFVPGMLHTVLLFLLLFVACVAILHAALGVVDPGLAVLAPATFPEIAGEETLGRLEYVQAVLSTWYHQRLAVPFREVALGVPEHLPMMVGSFVSGIAWSLAWFVVATCLAFLLAKKGGLPAARTRSGWTREDQAESGFVRWFNVTSVALAVGAVPAAAYFAAGPSGPGRFLAALALPLAFSLGGLAIMQLMTFFAETIFAQLSWLTGKSYESRFRRSLYGAIRGACVYGVVAAAAIPASIIVLLSLSVLPLKFFVSLAALAWAYFVTRGKGGPTTLQLGGWLDRPAANLAVCLFIAFGFSEISARLVGFYRTFGHEDLVPFALTIAGGALAGFLLLGWLIDANRVSPHYFYRDRLTEAYLKTDARTVRADETPATELTGTGTNPAPGGRAAPLRDLQGMPLKVLRDDENLKLSELGKDNGRGPYHLIVTALNLRGSNELNRKSFLSDHFVFSRDTIGSRVTGWVRTKSYRSDSTRLARAMTISAAAVGSAMGYQSFGAQAFVATLLNMRLGYWMENPWIYRYGGGPPAPWRPTFWPWYLMLEIFGLTSARTRMVNLSDGGHTGDNLGLLPLLQRRCGTIVVSDAEADPSFSFESFNNAVRMAFIEENIRIDIDLGPIMSRQESPAGIRVNGASVAVGEIHYPRTPGGEPEAFGRLVYLKASVSGGDIPVHVVNYAKGSDAFPQESTADQFFDDAQFEAYRALGQQVGEQAAGRLAAILAAEGTPAP